MPPIHICSPAVTRSSGHPVRPTTIRDELTVRSGPQFCEQSVIDIVHERERVQAGDEERFALEHVADASRHGLVQQQLGKGRLRSSSGA